MSYANKDISDFHATNGRDGLRELATNRANLIDITPPPAPAQAAPMAVSVQSPGENGENGENARLARAAFAENSPNSPNSPRGYRQQISFPDDSFISDYMAQMRESHESADCYFVGALLPICGSLLARRIWFPWGGGKQFPNVFSMLAGKAGDRKSSCINEAARLIRSFMPPEHFLPGSFSPETLFDEFDEQPDKLWIVDDANGVLTDWRQSGNGERNAARFLELYDCCPLSESFRRNKSRTNPDARRSIPETSTSLLFGATFNVASFQNQAIRTGMARRFLYHVADGHARVITTPPAQSLERLESLSEDMKGLLAINSNQQNGALRFTPDAEKLWVAFQHANRERQAETDALQEAKLSRLSSEPMQALHVAMIFEACRFARTPADWSGDLRSDTLQHAIDYVAGCQEAAEFLEQIANRAALANDAEILLAKIRRDVPACEGFHFATRSELTGKYAAHGSRHNATTTNDLYLKIIPQLARQGEARRIRKNGKLEMFAFRGE